MSNTPKQLLLLRHATTEAVGYDGNDFERNLTAEGELEAAAIGNYLREHKLTPDAIYCSPAKRTRQTCEIAIAASHANLTACPLQFEPKLYLAELSDMLNFIETLPESCDKALIISHNPTLHALVQSLTGEVLSHFSPATLAHINYENTTAWRDITSKTGTLAALKSASQSLLGK